MNALTATTTATKTRLSQLVLLALTSLLAALALAHPAQAADTTAKQVTSGPTAGPSIIGGYYPHASQWPWMAALLDRTKSGSDYYRHQCGGALIHARLVLTAAHCVTNDGSRIAASNLEVVLGKRRLSVAGGEHIGISRIVIHPQSVIHSLVEYVDGSVLAQLGSPDMRIPIAYTLAWPERMETPCERLDLVKVGSLAFEEPDLERFPALALAKAVLREGGAKPAILNAANEIAVASFLESRIAFLDIASVAAETLSGYDPPAPRSVDEVLEVDRQARLLAGEKVGKFSN